MRSKSTSKCEAVQAVHDSILTMKTISALLLAATLVVSGCASVEMAPPNASSQSKEFNAPSQGKAGIYIYRDSFMGKMLKKDIWINGKCLGESGPDVFFYTEVEGGRTHKIETESEFSPNAMTLTAEPGQKYFIRQYTKVGLLVEGANLERVSEARGKAAIAKLNMAKTGTCSGAR
jgi:Protein of unknown function (DUF2846)